MREMFCYLRCLLVTAALAAAGCASNIPPADDGSPGIEPAKWFPADYKSSRDRFRADCKRFARPAADICGKWRLAKSRDPDLTIDYGIFTRGGDKLLVIQSGIHGTEAAAGAAVQAYVMDKWLEPLLKSGIDVVFIHALNPWGFKYDRRNDEYNVNLNRNFSVDGADYRFDNAEYRRFQPLFEPAGPVKSTFRGSANVTSGFLNGFIASGFSGAALANGLDSGQYEFPDGINYGGRGPQSQTRFLKQVIGPILARAYKKTLYLDFHTGLGENGVLAVIQGKHLPERALWELRQMLQRYDDKGIKIKTPDDPGFFATVGDVIDFVPSLSRRPETFLAVTMEYGTLGLSPGARLESASRMILENQKHRYGCASPAICDRIDEATREMFNPADPAWRRAVIREADIVFRTLRDKF